MVCGKAIAVKAYVKGKRNLVNSFGFEKKILLSSFRTDLVDRDYEGIYLKKFPCYLKSILLLRL